ncbi:MAG: hypothetical protein LUC44_09215 [Prevotellaceae bacterium]|nr:hypothetical protein [Prevotellaceae bacterium]
MKRRAYNRLVTPDGQTYHNVVVVFDDADSPVSWHPLEAEEPYVEWVGGCYTVLSPV